MQGRWLGDWQGDWFGGSVPGGGASFVSAALSVVGVGSVVFGPIVTQRQPPTDPPAATAGFATGGGPGAHIPLTEWRRLHSPAARRRISRRRKENDRVSLGLL